MTDQPETIEADVAVVGGSFSGSSTALLLRREKPGLRVVVVEKSKVFDRKVGEATTEVSGAFLTRRLKLTHHLNHFHIVKNGLRFWFSNEAGADFETAGETGASYQVRLPTFQVDREVLDSHLLKEAEAAGARVLRPARVLSCEEKPGGEGMELRCQTEQGEKILRARWMIDASGKAAWWARKQGLLEDVPEHPTNAVWARVSGVADMDGWKFHNRFPGLGGRVSTSRASATNHLTGYGWWCWIIPLRGGDTSVGLVYDRRLFELPEGASLGERLLAHLHADPLGKLLFQNAQVVEKDVKAYSQLPYFSREIAGPSWQLAGDAAGFMDPLYSAGLDYCSWTVSAAVNRVIAEADGVRPDLDALNRNFRESYLAWLRALYLDKYYYLGDRELMNAAYLMDLGLFFFGPVREIVHCPRKGFAELPFCGPVDRVVGKVMAFYNARLSELARKKHRLGVYGAENHGEKLFVPGFSPSWVVWKRVLDGAAAWGKAELRMLFAKKNSLPNADEKNASQEDLPAPAINPTPAPVASSISQRSR